MIFSDKGYTSSQEEIGPYLAFGNGIAISKHRKPISKLPIMMKGSQPTDGGGLLISESEYNGIKQDYPSLMKYVYKYIGSKDFINGNKRYALWLTENDYKQVKDNPEIKRRMKIVYESRTNSTKKSTRQLAKTPYRFDEIRREQSNCTIISPAISSGNRLYVPMGIVGNDVVVSNTAQTIYNANLWILGLLESKMFTIWLSNIGGKFKTDYIVSASLVYNTFPVPNLSTRRKNEIEELVWKILDIRDEEGGTLADLYGSPLAEKNPKPMNPRLLAAHQELDEVVDRAYRDRPFKDDNERLSLLLNMYSQKVNEEK